MGTGAWRAEVHGVAESWTQLSNGAQRSICVNTYVKMTCVSKMQVEISSYCFCASNFNKKDNFSKNLN